MYGACVTALPFRLQAEAHFLRRSKPRITIRIARPILETASDTHQAGHSDLANTSPRNCYPLVAIIIRLSPSPLFDTLKRNGSVAHLAAGMDALCLVVSVRSTGASSGC